MCIYIHIISLPLAELLGNWQHCTLWLVLLFWRAAVSCVTGMTRDYTSNGHFPGGNFEDIRKAGYNEVDFTSSQMPLHACGLSHFSCVWLCDSMDCSSPVQRWLNGSASNKICGLEGDYSPTENGLCMDAADLWNAVLGEEGVYTEDSSWNECAWWDETAEGCWSQV